MDPKRLGGNQTKPKTKSKHVEFFVAVLALFLFQIFTFMKLTKIGAFDLLKEYNYGDDPDSFSSQPPQPPDIEIERLWKGNAYGGDPNSFQRIHLVVSHCLEDFSWMSNFTKEFTIFNTTIISKCDSQEDFAPENTTVVRLPNVGRCDHSYAWWMSRYSSQINDDDAVIFLKASSEIHQMATPRYLTEMLRITSINGFGCWLEPKWGLSAFHDTKELYGFFKHSHVRKTRDKQPAFKSQFKNLGAWLRSMNAVLPNPATQVCYGGIFAVKGSQIKGRGASLWSKIENSLTRGDNIEEGHFAERSWAGLLSYPPPARNITELYNISKVATNMGRPYKGLLVKK